MDAKNFWRRPGTPPIPCLRVYVNVLGSFSKGEEGHGRATGTHLHLFEFPRWFISALGWNPRQPLHRTLHEA